MNYNIILWFLRWYFIFITRIYLRPTVQIYSRSESMFWPTGAHECPKAQGMRPSLLLSYSWNTGSVWIRFSWHLVDRLQDCVELEVSKIIQYYTPGTIFAQIPSRRKNFCTPRSRRHCYNDTTLVLCLCASTFIKSVSRRIHDVRQYFRMDLLDGMPSVCALIVILFISVEPHSNEPCRSRRFVGHPLEMQSSNASTSRTCTFEI